MPQRLKALNQWLKGSLSLENFVIEPASDDASFRRYFRISYPDGKTLIAMDAPPEKENCRPFVEIARNLHSKGINVPKILAENHDAGFLLLSDLGKDLYLDRLSKQNVARLYDDALRSLATMQAGVSTQHLPSYDRSLLSREMSLFTDWLVPQLLRITLDDAQQTMLDVAFEQLILNAEEQPKVFVHRDYHSRNLMLTREHNPGILDFQDAVSGPITYDLVSLLRDCYIRWPKDQVHDWVYGYYHLAVQTGILPDHHEAEFLHWFDLMGIQRHLKVAGIFARLYLRDGKAGYLKDIPRTLEYIIEVAEDHSEFTALGAFISQQVLPATTDFVSKTLKNS